MVGGAVGRSHDDVSGWDTARGVRRELGRRTSLHRRRVAPLGGAPPMGRKIITTTFVTMDGVMQAPGRPEEDTSGGFKYGGWQANVMDDSLGEAINEFLKPP